MIRWLRVLFAVIGGVLAIWLLQGDTSGQEAEGALGHYPVPAVVGMSGEPLARVYVLTAGVVSSADHEADEDPSYFSVGKVTLVVPPDGIPAIRLRELRGAKVELSVRVIK